MSTPGTEPGVSGRTLIPPAMAIVVLRASASLAVAALGFTLLAGLDPPGWPGLGPP